MSQDDPVLAFVRSDFSKLPVYTPVQPLDVLAGEIGVPESALVKLDANENLYGPLPEVLAALSSISGSAHIYPDPAQGKLRKALAEYVNLTPDDVLGGV